MSTMKANRKPKFSSTRNQELTPKHQGGPHIESELEDVTDYFTKDGASKLRASLGRTVKGQPNVYTAPFARKGDQDIPMEQVLGEWLTILESIQEKWPSLWEFENDLARKVGPMSIELPLKDRIEDIEHYYTDILLPQKPIDARAIKAVIKEFAGARGLHPRTLTATYEKMKKSSSAGSPTMGKRRDHLADQIASNITCIPETNNIFAVYRNRLDKAPDSNCYELTAVLGWRGQEGGPSDEDVKQRVIWMFPSVANLHELSVYQPLIEVSQKLDLVPAWVSMDRVDEHITKLFDSKGSTDLVVCTDFSKFDQHFNKTMRSAAKSILSAILDKSDSSHYWLNEIFPIKYYIPLTVRYIKGSLYANNPHHSISLYKGEHGMASGSGGTNADETLAHRALQYEAAILNNARLNPHSMCLGDDGILTYPGITVDDVVEVYKSHGQECNVDKQYASSQDCVYLRRWHHKDYRVNGVCAGVYSTCRALGRLRYLERFMDPEFWDEKMVALRQLSIIENCNHHPLFEEFVDFCMERDKYRLGLDIPGFFDSLDKRSQEAIDHMPDFLGYVKTLQSSGKAPTLSEWKVVQYLKSKA
nr:MAG: putative RNA-dependent RNA polymerase [Picobirnavirus sp.]